MGTETVITNACKCSIMHDLVKLNNPQMGTEIHMELAFSVAFHCNMVVKK